MNLTATNFIPQQQHQAQQQQQIANSISSSSPLSNSSTNSSCLTTSSFSSPSSYSSIIYTTASGAPALIQPNLLNYAANQSQLNNYIALNTIAIPAQNANSVTNTSATTTTNQSTNGLENNVLVNTPNGTSNSASSTTVTPNNITTPGTSTTPTIIASIPPTYLNCSNNNSNSIIGKPEAKKVKTQKSQPSKVVHIRNIPQQITEVEIIQFGLIFGNIDNVLNLRSKCQAFLEFEKCEEAQSMINYFANNPISVAGRQIFVQFSNYKNLVTDPSNTNNQVAKAALDLAKELHKAAQSGGQNTVLRAMIQNMLYTVSLDTIYQIFNRFGPVLKIITFTKNDKFQALIQMKDAACAQAAKTTLHGQNIYGSCCTLHIDYSKLNTLNVKYNNEKSRDYTNPLLPAGDCPDHLALGPGGIINTPLQLLAAAGYTATPFSSTLPAGFHLAPASSPFISFAGKYLPQQTLINASNLLQPAANANLTAANSLAAQAAVAAASAPQLASVHHSANQLSNQHQIQLAVAGLNQTQANQVASTQAQTQTMNGIATNPNGTLTPNSHIANSGQPVLIPFLQNINDEAYIMMYTQ